MSKSIKVHVSIEQYFEQYAETAKNKLLNNIIEIMPNPNSGYKVLKCEYCGKCYPYSDITTIIENNKLNTYCFSHIQKIIEIDQKSAIKRLLEEQLEEFLTKKKGDNND